MSEGGFSNLFKSKRKIRREQIQKRSKLERKQFESADVYSVSVSHGNQSQELDSKISTLLSKKNRVRVGSDRIKKLNFHKRDPELQGVRRASSSEKKELLIAHYLQSDSGIKLGDNLIRVEDKRDIKSALMTKFESLMSKDENGDVKLSLERSDYIDLIGRFNRLYW